MINSIFFKKFLFISLIILLASCDKDFNTIGSDVIGNEDFKILKDTFTVKAYNQKIPAVETGNSVQNQLGVLANRNGVLGTTTANTVISLSLATLKPTIGANVVIDSVILTVPYLSTKTSGSENTNGTYTLNGIYTTNTLNSYDAIDLKVYRNGLFLRDIDPVTGVTQKHFSNEDPLFNSNKLGPILNDSPIVTENTAFKPSEKEFRKFKVVNNLATTDIDSRSSPRIRLHLNTDEFRVNIIVPAKAPTTAFNFETQEAFKNYYKGLYFKTTQIGGEGTSMLLDFSAGNVTIYYKEDGTTAGVREMKSIVMNMTGNTVNLFNNVDNPVYSTDVLNPNTNVFSKGNKKLYLKGGEGSMSYVELFNQVELDNLRSQQLLINEASLTFTVDNTAITSDYNKAKRIYIFNADDNTPLFDYFFDSTTNSADLTLSKSTHDGILQTVAGGKDKYRIRITEHINNIIKKGAKNVRLGVVVTDNIAQTLTRSVITETNAPSIGDATKKLLRVPTATILSRSGTVLYGTGYKPNDGDDYNHRLKFEIYYTKPN